MEIIGKNFYFFAGLNELPWEYRIELAWNRADHHGFELFAGDSLFLNHKSIKIADRLDVVIYGWPKAILKRVFHG